MRWRLFSSYKGARTVVNLTLESYVVESLVPIDD
jgi:hypothetical protein